MTGIPIRDSGDGIWDDGEWISWAYINQQLAEQEDAERPVFSEAVQPRGQEILSLIKQAVVHDQTHGLPSPLWGRIGELYAAERFGVSLSRAYAQGHDGRLGDDLVEIKTITPHKRRAFVRVKRSGNYSLLAVVRVNQSHQLDARLVRRSLLPAGGPEGVAMVSWSTICRVANEV